jgi:hypothetical protein
MVAIRMRPAVRGIIEPDGVERGMLESMSDIEPRISDGRVQP